MSSESAQDPVNPASEDHFRRACGRFTTGVAIATVVDAEGAPHGLTVNSFTSVSLDPPLVLVAVAHRASVMDAFREARFFAVNVLSAGQREISDRFARTGLPRFDGLEWHAGETGAPLLAGTLAELECAIRYRFPAGDHDLIVGEVLRSEVREGKPLVYFAGRYRNLAGSGL